MAEKKRKGFACMTPERVSEIARMGGQTAHKKGTAHQWDKREARAAGKIGGQSISRDRAYMAEIGRRGGATRRRQIAEARREARALASV